MQAAPAAWVYPRWPQEPRFRILTEPAAQDAGRRRIRRGGAGRRAGRHRRRGGGRHARPQECCWSSATAFSAAWAPPPASPISAACTPTCTARSSQVVHGVADELLGAHRPPRRAQRAASRASARSMAQAYDTAAYKCAADELLLCSRRRSFCFHALGDRRRRWRRKPHQGAAGRNASRAAARSRHACSSIARATAILPPLPARLSRKATTAGNMLFPTMMFRVNGVDAARAGEAWRTIPALMEAGGKTRREDFRARARSCGRRSIPTNGASMSRNAKMRGWPRGRRHRRRRIERRRDRGPPAGARLLRVPASARRPASPTPISSTSRRSSACAKRGGSRANTNSPPTTSFPARALPTPSASTAGRSRTMSPAT